jgi:hypothetical protein
MNKKQSIGLCSLLLTSAIAHADVSGIVFKDIPFDGTNTNTYGVKDANEKGVAGITVTAGGKSMTTDATGAWSLKSTGKVKVEFTNIPTYLKEGAGQSSVQFIDGDSTAVNLALYDPSEYSEGTTDIAMTTQVNSSLNHTSEVYALRVLSQDDIPTTNNSTAPVINVSKDIQFSKLGTVWGLTYDKTHKDLYVAAVARRHGAIGKDGIGAIYKINRESGVVETFVTVANVGTIPENSDRNLSDDPTKPNHDTLFNEVGRVGLGDIDISEDGTKLYVVNVNANTLVEIDIATKVQTPIGIGNPFGAGCPSDDVKSWGIGQNNGDVYVGSVCTTNTAQGAYISKLNGSTFEGLHQVPLDMDGENSLYTGVTPTATNTNNGKRWRTWITEVTDLFDGTGRRSSLAAPILSDIVFDENKNMILGFIDRTGMQAGVSNYSPNSNDSKTYKYDSAGDILKVCNIDGEYINEGGEGCTYNDTTGKEFFTEEEWRRDGDASKGHKEITQGGLAYQQGSNSLLSSAFDPAITSADNYDTSGIIWMNTADGKKTAGQVMVGERGSLAYNGKAGGIGDIEILTPPAPTEIGNRVWFDENANCVQDANESGIEGVKVNLYASDKCEGSAEQTTTTDENGSYLFPVNAGTEYSVCINGIATQTVLNDKKLTCNTAGTLINNSDAIQASEDARIAVSPLSTGANDHSFDFGFTGVKATTPTPVTPVDNNRTVDHNDGTCDCHSYEEDSTPALSAWSMMILLSLTSFMAFLFRKELNEVTK